jgi:hypothetical protein
MHDEPTTPEAVEALPIEQRAAAYLAAQEALEARLRLPVS